MFAKFDTEQQKFELISCQSIVLSKVDTWSELQDCDQELLLC